MRTPTDIGDLRVALVHDFLLDVRGAERVFSELCALFPEADVYTAVYNERGTQGRFAHRDVRTTYLQRARPTAGTFRALLPFYPAAIESLDLRGYDLVLSSSSAWAHGVIAGEHAVHVCYCHNPFRYAWSDREEVLAGYPAPLRIGLGRVLRRWRQWDTVAAQRVDRYVANSETTRRRIQRSFGRSSEVVAPPVETERFTPLASPPGADAPYVTLSALMPHKRLDVAVRAFTQAGLPLVVIGNGPDHRRLTRLAGPTVRFAGRLSDPEVARALAGCRALVVTATEEFGIAAVEAQAAGRPVIALRAGGLRETVREGVTGCFYDEPEPASLLAAVRAFDPDAIDPADCVASAQRFDRARFAAEITRVTREALGARDRQRAGTPPWAPRGRTGLRARGRGLTAAR